MSVNPAYWLVANRPMWSLEASTYARYEFSVVLTAPTPISWEWAYPRPTLAMRVRPWVMDCPTQAKTYLSDWIVLAPAEKTPLFTVDVPTEDYFAGADIDEAPTLARARAVPFRMQRAVTGPPQTHVGVKMTRYEGAGPGEAILPVPATRPTPVTTPAPSRPAQPFATVLTANQMWAPFISCFTGAFMRYFFETTRKLGAQTVAVLTTHANRQQYYDESVRNRELPIIDGERGEGTDGLSLALYPRAYSYGDAHAHTLKTGQSWWSATPHAAREKWRDGSIVTLFGERLKAGAHPYDWRQADPDNPAYDPDLLARKTEVVGHFIDCHPRLEEPWWIWGRPEPNPPGHEGHEQVEHWGGLNNSLRHEILSFTHFTAHKDPAHYVKSAWMPSNYVAPDAPHGQTDIMHLAGNRDGTPMGRLVNMPWGGVDPWLNERLPDHEDYRDKVAITNKFGATFCWVGLKTQDDVTAFYTSPVLLPPTGQEIRTGLLVWDRPAMRAAYPQPSATEWFPLEQLKMIRPSAMDMFSDGNLCVADDATGWIFDIDHRARRAKIIYTYTKGKNIWIWLAVNWRGDTGPLDCIRITGWSAGGDQCITRQGVVLGQAVPGSQTGGVSVLQGSAHYAGAMGYPAAIATRNGYIACSDGGHYELAVRVPKLASDPILDTARYLRGGTAWSSGTEPSLSLTHGTRGQGRFGLPTCFEIASWDDAKATAYLVAQGLSLAQANDVLYMFRYDTAGSNVAPPTPDTTPPPAPGALTVMAAWEGTPQTATLTLTCPQVNDPPTGQKAARYHGSLNGMERTVVAKPADPAAQVVLVIDGITAAAEPAFPWEVSVRAGDAATPENLGPPVTESVEAADFPDSQAPAIPVVHERTTLWTPPTLTLAVEAPQVLDAPGDPATLYPVYLNGVHRLTAYPPHNVAVPLEVCLAIDTSQIPGPYVLQMTAMDQAGNESGLSAPLSYAIPDTRAPDPDTPEAPASATPDPAHG